MINSIDIFNVLISYLCVNFRKMWLSPFVPIHTAPSLIYLFNTFELWVAYIFWILIPFYSNPTKIFLYILYWFLFYFYLNWYNYLLFFIAKCFSCLSNCCKIYTGFYPSVFFKDYSSSYLSFITLGLFQVEWYKMRSKLNFLHEFALGF